MTSAVWYSPRPDFVDMSLSFGFVESSNGVRVFFATERGPGMPLLISHALANPGASTIMDFEPGFAFIRGLAKGASWLMYDCRNSGRSSRTGQQPTFDDLTDDLEAVARLIEEPFDLYGRADGCALAVALARRRPESVGRMLLASPARIQHQWKRVPEYTQLYVRRFGTDPVGTLATHLVSCYPGVNPSDALAAAKKHMEAMPLDVIRSTERAFVGVDLEQLGSGVRAPALLLCQENEIEFALEAAACLPRTRVSAWNRLGNGSVNGGAWRQAWDEMCPADGDGPAVGTGLRGDRPTVETPVALSLREREVLQLIGEGKTNRQIAEALFLAQGTVARHVHNILTKLELSNRAAAAAWAATRERPNSR